MSGVLDAESFQILYGLSRGLLHSLWQCAAVALLLAGALALLRGSSSNARYVAACCAMALMLLLPSATAWKFLSSTPGAQMADASEVAGAPGEFVVEPAPGGHLYEKPVTASAGSPRPVRGESPMERAARLLPWLTLVWLAGVMLLSARTLGGLVLARRMKLRGARPVSGLWRERAAEIARKLSVSGPVKVLESSLVSVPTAVGPHREARGGGAQPLDPPQSAGVSNRVARHPDRQVVAHVLALGPDLPRHPPDRRVVEEKGFDAGLEHVHQVVVPPDVGQLVRQYCLQLLRREPCKRGRR